MDSETLQYLERFIEELKSTTTYQALLKYHQELKQDKDVITLSKAFKEKEKAYQEALVYGDFFPNLKERKMAFIKAKKALFEHQIVSTYKKNEREFQDQLDEALYQLTETISPRIFISTRLPLQSKGGKQC